jgi:clan AA aspartic protease (TIGR02281 family)
MNMSELKISLFLLMSTLVIMLLLPPPLCSEAYKYVDENGTIHFVDDRGKIPESYRDQVTVYEDESNSSSEEETPTASEGEGEKSEDYWTRKEQERKKQEEEKAREEFEKSLITQVTISGNHVLVPVTLGYGGNEVQANLVLDTGADLITLHRQIAEQLSLPLTTRAEVRVTGGKEIKARLAKLDYVKVGPYEAKEIHALIILHQGSAADHDGLLGMNFLRGLEYSIDFENQVIRWKP